MQILMELAKRGGGYIRSARQTKDASRRDRYLELAASCFTMAARRAESLIGQDVVRMPADMASTDPERMVC
jgi:hypothetical protein